MQFETERLRLRDITQADFDAWADILCDAETMAHYPAPYDGAGVQRWIDWTLKNYAQYGFGLWAVELKETGTFIGDCGITLQNIHGQVLPEIGYHLNKKYWRNGYGSEAAKRCMEIAFDTFRFPAVYSYMSADNAASWGVALKNGMQFLEEYVDEKQVLTRVYGMTREQWDNVIKG